MASLSVIIPCYNYAQYLPIALDAIVGQSFQPLEIIIIDDASSDNSIEIIKEYQKRHEAIRLYQNPQNMGVIATANRGIEIAKGDYLALCAADDEVLPTFFEKSMEMLNSYPTAGICTSRFCIFYDENPEKTFCFSKFLAQEKKYLMPKIFFKSVRRKDVRIGGQNTIFKREAVLQAGKLLPQFGPMCDWFLIYVLGFRHGVCYIPEALTKMRIHTAAYSQKSKKTVETYRHLVRNLDTTLMSDEYKDVKDLFIHSGIVYQLGMGILLPLILEKKFYKFINCFLLIHLSVTFLKHIKHFIFMKLRSTKK